MKWFLLWLLGSTGVLIVALCLTFLFLRGRIRRRHRIDRKVQTGAPLTWLVDPRAPARLHRRLARVGTTADAVISDHQSPHGRRALSRRSEPSPLATTAADLKAKAVEADRQLARIAVLAPAARRGALNEIGHQITELETAATRLAAMSASALTPSALQHHLHDDVAGQVARLAVAQRELDDLDAEAGLKPVAPNPLSTALPPPPADQRWSPPSGVIGRGTPTHG